MEASNQDISKAVALFRSAPNFSDVEIYKQLVREGLDRQLAARLVEFIPMAFCRILLEKSGARLSSSFVRLIPGGVTREQPLSSNRVWNEVFAFAVSAVGRVPANALLTLAGRSAEFQAANELLHNGSKLKDLAFTPSLLPWPENGPEIEPGDVIHRED
jgi:hypothetical protein